MKYQSLMMAPCNTSAAITAIRPTKAAMPASASANGKSYILNSTNIKRYFIMGAKVANNYLFFVYLNNNFVSLHQNIAIIAENYPI